MESQELDDPSLPGTETHISNSIINWNRLEPKAIEISFSLKKVAKSMKIWLTFYQSSLYIAFVCNSVPKYAC